MKVVGSHGSPFFVPNRCFVFSVFAPFNLKVAEGQMRIGRPRQLYVGPAQRHWKDTKVFGTRYCFGGEQQKINGTKTGGAMM